MIKKIQYLFFLLVALTPQIIIAADDVIPVDLRIKDHKFIPDIINLPADKKIYITVHNEDPTIEEFESFDLKREKIVPGNSIIKIILAPLAPGEYKFFGEFHQETAQGKIIVSKKSKE